MSGTLKKISASLCAVYIVLSLCTPVFANTAVEENTVGLANIGELYQDLGPLKLLMLTLTPKNQRAMYYHTVSIDASENCKSPNAWYFEGLVEDDICQQMKTQGYNVVCNTACPVERQTGATCGLSHKCCRPEVAPTSKKPSFRCSPDGQARGIQYCTFW